jgi:bifunctional oligoribonuclease and PAP phosphatase NrnA
MDVGPGRGWQSVHDIIEQHNTFLLTSHVFPEGDSIGSEIALALHLRDRRKKVYVLNPTKPRDCYRSLFDLYPVRHLGGKETQIPRDVDVVIALDVSQWDYVGPMAEHLRSRALPIVAIDHHHADDSFGDLLLIDPSAGSTGEMIYQYLRWAGARITPQIAEAIYTSLMFDTGGLRLPHTTNRSVAIAADLLRLGADHASVSRTIFQGESFQRMALYRLALEALRHEQGGRIAYASLPFEAFEATGTVLQDGDGILDNLLAIREIEVCALFREAPEVGVRVTFRSKGRHDVGEIATRLGGGGRPTAAGVFLPLSLSEAEGLVMPMIRELYEADDPLLAQRG